jgi:parallel beta-helix repeat protein
MLVLDSSCNQVSENSLSTRLDDGIYLGSMSGGSSDRNRVVDNTNAGHPGRAIQFPSGSASLMHGNLIEGSVRSV